MAQKNRISPKIPDLNSKIADVYSKAGEISLSMAAYEEARDWYEHHGVADSYRQLLLSDEARARLGARLFGEAVVLADAALDASSSDANEREPAFEWTAHSFSSKPGSGVVSERAILNAL